MQLDSTAIVLWAAGFLGNAALLCVLLARRRAALVPWFTAWVVFNLFYSVILYGVYSLCTRDTYRVVYWSGAFLDLALQVAMILEIAGYVFRRGAGWVGGARSRLVVAAAVAAVVAVSMAYTMVPAVSSRLSAWGARVDLGCTVLITLLFTAIMVVSHQLGVSWRSLLLREGYGVAAWSVFSFFTDTLHAYWRTAEHFEDLESVRIAVYLAALVYWIAVFWLPEAVPYVPDSALKSKVKAVRDLLE